MVVFKREFTIQSPRCTVNEQQINQNILLIMCLSSTYISITFSKEFPNEFPATLELIQQRKMRDAERTVWGCDASNSSELFKRSPSLSSSSVKLSLLYITNLFYMVLSTLVLYFGSEVCFETNVRTHLLCFLSWNSFWRHELDSFCMKLQWKMLSSSIANGLQPQTGLQFGTGTGLELFWRKRQNKTLGWVLCGCWVSDSFTL